MKKKRATVEEINAMNPSYENPVVLECDVGHYIDSLKRVKIIAPFKSGKAPAVDNKDEYDSIREHQLTHYSSPKARNIAPAWECYDNAGYRVLLFADGSSPNFFLKKKDSLHTDSSITCKVKPEVKVYIDLDTFEIVEPEEFE